MDRAYLIRSAELRDVSALVRVHAASWRTTYAGLVEDAFLDRLERELDLRIEQRRERVARPDAAVWVACTPKDHVVGFIDGGPIREPLEAYDQELYAIYLLQGWQGMGIGRALIRQLARHLESNGGQKLLVWVLKENSSGRSFYERLGGRLVAEKSIQIGSKTFAELAYGWETLNLFF